MWLINTATLQLEWFGSSRDVEYAILSHTWEDEEVNFQEMKNLTPSVRAKSGFRKIQSTCELALQQKKLKYAWVDTCCIDKSSSAELSEAINSMFRWYKDAVVCFAYLSDMFSLDTGLVELLQHCRWFTRGWTLQELIAPKSLELYDRKWIYRGSRDGLATVISNITGVDSSVLTGSSSLQSLPVARRMSWAAKRQTTREEDIAYCLLGIFDVNMPLLYGEGTKAFTRLQREILSQCGDLSLFCWQAALGTTQEYRGVLATSPREFADGGSLRYVNREDRYSPRFTPTILGYDIYAPLVIGVPDDPRYTLTLDVWDDTHFYESGRIGIRLAKTPGRMVRSDPSYVGLVERKADRTWIRFFMPEFIRPDESDEISKQLSGSTIQLRQYSNLQGIAAVPSRLWDSAGIKFLADELFMRATSIASASRFLESATFLLFRPASHLNLPPIQFMVICMVCEVPVVIPTITTGGAVSTSLEKQTLCIVKNELDRDWAETMSAMHHSEKGNLNKASAFVLDGQFGASASSNYVDELRKLRVWCTAFLEPTSPESGESPGDKRLRAHRDGTPSQYNLYVDLKSSDPFFGSPESAQHRHQDRLREHQVEALETALGYFFR